MHVVLVDFEINPGHEEAFLTRVRQQAADSLREEENCERFDVLTDPADARRIWLYEIYGTAQDFETHKGTAHFLSFDADVKPMVADKSVRILTLSPA